MKRTMIHIPALLLLAVAFGCSSRPKTETVYIPTDRRIETVTNSIGIVCKAIPNAVMEEMLLKIQELQDLVMSQSLG